MGWKNYLNWILGASLSIIIILFRNIVGFSNWFVDSLIYSVAIILGVLTALVYKKSKSAAICAMVFTIIASFYFFSHVIFNYLGYLSYPFLFLCSKIVSDGCTLTFLFSAWLYGAIIGWIVGFVFNRVRNKNQVVLTQN